MLEVLGEAWESRLSKVDVGDQVVEEDVVDEVGEEDVVPKGHSLPRKISTRNSILTSAHAKEKMEWWRKSEKTLRSFGKYSTSCDKILETVKTSEAVYPGCSTFDNFYSILLLDLSLGNCNTSFLKLKI